MVKNKEKMKKFSCFLNLNCSATISDIIKGYDLKDPTTVKQQVSKSKVKCLDNLEGLTVGIPKEYHCSGLSSEMLCVWNGVADLLANNGAQVIQVNGEFLKNYIFHA